MFIIQKLVNKEAERVEKIIFNTIKNDDIVSEKILHFLKYPSKRIRTVLPLLYLKSNGIDISQELLNIIAAGEIIHNASLLHDDCVDDANMRRGNPVLAQQLSPKISIIAGDLLVSKAVKLILDIGVKPIINNFILCIENMCNAEIEQFISRGNVIDIDSYLNICKGKTSSLFIAILKSISEIAGLDVHKAEDFAESFGILFQIMNDLEPESAKQDKLNGITTITEIVGIEKTSILIDNYKEKMKSIINSFPVDEYRIGLVNLIDKL